MWHYVLCELDNATLQGRQIGEVNFAGDEARNFTRRLNGLPTADFTIRLDNPMAKEITDREGDVLLKVYEDSTLRFIGDCVSVEENGPGYKRIFNRDNLCNVAYALPSGSATDVRVASDIDSVDTRGMFEAVIPNNIADSGLRQAYIEEAIRLRATAQEVITIQPGSGDRATLTCNFAGPLWRLGKRLAAQIPSGGTVPDPAVVTFPSTDRAQIVKQLLDNANTIHDTGIRAGTFGTLFPIAIGTDDAWTFKFVAEAMSDLASARQFPFEATNTGTALAYDDFGTSIGNLAGPPGRSAPRGGVWQAAGSSGDFTGFGGGPAIVRSTTGDTAPGGTSASLGRFDYLSSGPYTSQFAQIDTVYGGSISQPQKALGQGVLARFIDTSPGNWFRASLYLLTQGYLAVEKCVNGTVTQLSHSVPISLTSGTAYSIRLQADTSGNWAAWLWQVGTSDPPAPYLRGQDSDLATGGPLASGKVGIWDLNNSTQAVDRVYDTFLAQTPLIAMDTGVQALEFEIVPTEPTVDGTGVQIGTLHVSSRVGTDKTASVVFEMGGGNPITNTPTFGTDYTEGDSVTARAQVNGSARFNGTVRVFGVNGSIDKEGKETIVPQLSDE